ncbi:MAG: N-acyl homoserine lactonase family protein [Phenylobacterium sp.]|uniref:N-acyl homoserine lactonase family protein n=1 Tax=Phenylobacterium sp. TaxID=1871053 RepID=UPI001A605059|nr:N-acyl homoserine lactonase family protein [Phenylobacterium sp.]MBL8554677.1 N-acyl homoserine lactonase family protein [Phenylobacterium sp.]
MSVQLHAFTCGWLTIPRAFMLDGEDGLIKVPVPSYLITHPKGRVLFDTGLHAETLEDPAAYVGEMLARYHTFDFTPGQEIAARLAAFGVDPAGIDIVINSHLHFDHCGGNAQLPNADVLIQRRELEHARAVESTRGYLVSDWDTGQRVRAVEGEHDVFGDGTVVCLPTYGHTPGHQSLRVRTETGGEFVLCGDACYLRDSLEKLRLPGVIADKEAALAVFRRLREMQSRGVTIMYGHDPDFWTTVPQAPVRLG